MGDAHGCDPDGTSETRLRDASFLQDFSKENARMNRGKAALDHVCSN
jgi:hypothetical protein